MIANNKYLLVGAAAAGLCIAYLAYRGVGKVADAAVDTAREVGHAINPMNNDNVFNVGAEALYQAVTGSAGTPGSDFYDGTHGGWLDITSPNNIINQGFEGTYRMVTGSTGSPGGDLAGGVTAVSDWWDGLWK